MYKLQDISRFVWADKHLNFTLNNCQVDGLENEHSKQGNSRSRSSQEAIAPLSSCALLSSVRPVSQRGPMLPTGVIYPQQASSCRSIVKSMAFSVISGIRSLSFADEYREPRQTFAESLRYQPKGHETPSSQASHDTRPRSIGLFPQGCEAHWPQRVLTAFVRLQASVRAPRDQSSVRNSQQKNLQYPS